MRTTRGSHGSADSLLGVTQRDRDARPRRHGRVVAAAMGAGLIPAAMFPGAVHAAPAAPARPFDFNGDGHTDLTVGIPLDRVGSTKQAGAVAVLPGSATGTTTAGDQLWHENRKGVVGAAQRGDRFGKSLRPETSTVTGSPTWRSGSPRRRSAARPTWGRSTSSTAARPG